MDILNGLSATQIAIVHRCRSYQEFEAGQIIFNEGDPAHSMFTILSGTVEIFRREGERDHVIARLGSPEVFGELGLLTKAGRTASARAVENTLLFEIPTNLVDVMKEFAGAEGTLKLIENLICILGERLRKSNDHLVQMPASTVLRNTSLIQTERREAMAAIERNLPKGLTRKFPPQSQIEQDDFLCREGEPAENFFFIHQGELEVVKEIGVEEPRVMGSLKGPTITGELGFFTRQPRAAGLRAKTRVKYTPFSGMDFFKLRQSNPDEALNVLFAAARLAVYIFVRGSKL